MISIKFAERIRNVDGAAIADILKASADPSIISLAGGNPASELFPNKELAEISYDLLLNQPVLTLQYSVAGGYAPLREEVKKMLAERDNISAENNDIIITSGSQQGMDFVAKCILNEGDSVIVENPSFLGETTSLRGYGVNLIGVNVQNDGIDTVELEKVLSENKNIKLIYTIPSFQNPTGITQSLEKRKEVLRIASKYNVLILEDNPYGELTFDGTKLPTLKSMDTENRVIYAGSFSKILAPGLRVGYIYADKELIGHMIDAKQANDTHSPMLTQLLVYEYLRRYGIADNIQRMRELYRRKCQCMLDAMKEYFPEGITYTTPAGGLFIWCDMGEGFDTLEVYEECIKEKVAFVPGAPFMADPSKKCSAFRLNYSTMSDENIRLGIKLLGGKLREFIK